VTADAFVDRRSVTSPVVSSAGPRLLLLGSASARPDGLERALARAGFQLLEADAPPRGAPQPAAGEPDLVLVTLPAGAPELESHLRRNVQNGHRVARVVLLDGGGIADLERAIALGADDALLLPVVLPELVARLRGRLARNAGRRSADAERLSDPLTGCATPALLAARVAEELERARRYALGFSLVLLDVDEVRAVNGRRGAEAGDRILSEVGAALRGELRGPDLVARCGGDEFALLLPETGGDGARSAVLRVRDRLLRLDGHRHPADDELEPPSPLAVSAGIASFPHPAVESPGDLLALAEAALGRGKANVGERIGMAV
jgi:diguanylate cyclase (GGDEF)-like protein